MKSANDYFYICEDGHVTVGKGKTNKKCSQKIQHVKLVKKGKTGIDKEVLKTSVCGKELTSVNPVPPVLNLFEEWSYHQTKGFMKDQDYDSLKIGFIRSLQSHMTKLHTTCEDLKEQIKDLNRRLIAK